MTRITPSAFTEKKHVYHHVLTSFSIAIGVWTLHSTNFRFLPEMASSGVGNQRERERESLCVCVYVYLYRSMCRFTYGQMCAHTLSSYGKITKYFLLHSMLCIQFSSDIFSLLSLILCIFYKANKPVILFFARMLFSCFFVVVALKQCYYSHSSFESVLVFFFPKAWNYEFLPNCFSAKVDSWMICIETSCYLCTVTEVVLRLS